MGGGGGGSLILKVKLNLISLSWQCEFAPRTQFISTYDKRRVVFF